MEDNKELKKKKKLEKKIIKKEKKKLKKERNRLLNMPPKRGVLEEIGNSVTHGVGALLGILGLILLLLKSDTPLKIMASIFYGVSIFIMMLSSCLYHAFKSDSTVKRIFRRFDYIGIYLLIGGTFAPIFLVYQGDLFGIILFCIQWAAIITGVTFVSIFGPGRVKLLNFILYFVIGWSGLIFIPSFIKNNIQLLYWILIGGVAYTLGMIPFTMKNSKVAHFIWHFFVLIGAALHFIGIYILIY